MRELKFRGLTNKGWVYGLPFFAHGTGEWRITQSDGWQPTYQNPDEGESTKFDNVDSKTVTQYTGLKDKNGTEIYEGDILKTVTDKSMVVGWSEKFASFILERKDWAFSHWFGESCDSKECLVIGNIHENPELLTT